MAYLKCSAPFWAALCVVRVFPVSFSQVFLFVFINGYFCCELLIILKENGTVKCPVSNYRFELLMCRSLITVICYILVCSPSLFPHSIVWTRDANWQLLLLPFLKVRNSSYHYLFSCSCSYCCGQPLQKSARLHRLLVTNWIGMRFGRNVLHLNTNQLTESGYWFDVIIFKGWP